EPYSWKLLQITDASLFREITRDANITGKHKDFEHIDFNIQTTLPHKLSEYCPALAVGDIDGNGLDDIIMGGNSGVHAQLFLQQKNGSFLQKGLLDISDDSIIEYKDGGILLFDANGDGKLDLYITG